MAADPILDAINAVREDVRTNHENLNRRLDLMVSKDVHEAEVRRIDAALDAQKRSHADLKTQVITGDNAILQKIAENHKAQADKEAAVQASAKADRRWFLGWGATLCGIAVALASYLTNLLGG